MRLQCLADTLQIHLVAPLTKHSTDGQVPALNRFWASSHRSPSVARHFPNRKEISRRCSPCWCPFLGLVYERETSSRSDRDRFVVSQRYISAGLPKSSARLPHSAHPFRSRGFITALCICWRMTIFNAPAGVPSGVCLATALRLTTL